MKITVNTGLKSLHLDNLLDLSVFIRVHLWLILKRLPSIELRGFLSIRLNGIAIKPVAVPAPPLRRRAHTLPSRRRAPPSADRPPGDNPSRNSSARSAPANRKDAPG